MLEPCPTCGERGFLRQDVPLSDPRFGLAIPCPNCESPSLEEMTSIDLERKQNGTDPYRGIQFTGTQVIYDWPASQTFRDYEAFLSGELPAQRTPQREPDWEKPLGAVLRWMGSLQRQVNALKETEKRGLPAPAKLTAKYPKEI